MTFPSLLLTAVLVVLAWSGSAVAMDETRLIAPQDALQKGVTQADFKQVMAARAQFQALAAAHPKDVSPHYFTAVADWRLVPLLNAADEVDLAEKHCEAGIAAADHALEIDPDHAEAIAVKVGLQGMSLQFKDPMAGMVLGPKMDASLSRALKLAPNNPRVQLMEAINIMLKPAFVGGGAKASMPKFERAQKLASAEKPSAHTWGHEDVWVWSGRAAMQLEHFDEAKRCFERVLEMNPEHTWTKTTLLPHVEQQLAGKGD